MIPSHTTLAENGLGNLDSYLSYLLLPGDCLHVHVLAKDAKILAWHCRNITLHISACGCGAHSIVLLTHLTAVKSQPGVLQMRMWR